MMLDVLHASSRRAKAANKTWIEATYPELTFSCPNASLQRANSQDIGMGSTAAALLRVARRLRF